MKDSLSGMEIRAIIREMQPLLGARVDKIFNPESQEFYIRIHKTGIGQKLIRIKLPSLIYMTDTKPVFESSPEGFCMYLRKHLSNARLSSISQIGLERMVILSFETKEGKYDIIIELFSTGNLIFCKDGIILSAVVQKRWKDRSILPKKEYVPPPQKIDPFSLDIGGFLKLADGSKDTKISKFLAVNLSFGGNYAKEILQRSGCEDDLSEESLRKVYDEIIRFSGEDIDPYLVKDGYKIVEVIPHKLNTDGSYILEKCESFNKGIDMLFNSGGPVLKVNRKLEKIRTMITAQESQIKKFEEKMRENEKSAELIYSNYPFISELLSSIKTYKSNRSWEEIKSALEKHEKISFLDVAKKKVTLDLQ